MSRRQFEASCGPQGANFVGSPEQIVEKMGAGVGGGEERVDLQERPGVEVCRPSKGSLDLA